MAVSGFVSNCAGALNRKGLGLAILVAVMVLTGAWVMRSWSAQIGAEASGMVAPPP